VTEGKVLVVNASGSVVRTFDDLPYPDAMTLSDDGSTLFVSFLQDPMKLVTAGLDLPQSELLAN